MSLEELFEHISSEFMARLMDSYHPGPMMDSRLPKVEVSEANIALSQLFDMIESRAPFLNQHNTRAVKLLEVDKDEEYAILDVIPTTQASFAAEPCPPAEPRKGKKRTRTIALPRG